MDIAWYCGRNGRRIFVLAVCRLHHWDLPYHFFSCQQFHLGAAMGGLLLSSFMPEHKKIKKEE